MRLVVASALVVGCAASPTAPAGTSRESSGSSFPATTATGSLDSDAVIVARIEAFLDAMEAQSEQPHSAADDIARLTANEANATTLIDELAAAKPGPCLEKRLAEFREGLTALRDGSRAVLAAAPSGQSVSDDDYVNILGGIMSMGQSLADAKESCGL